jgi:cobalamin biosynthesis protein CbiD
MTTQLFTVDKGVCIRGRAIAVEEVVEVRIATHVEELVQEDGVAIVVKCPEPRSVAVRRLGR